MKFSQLLALLLTVTVSLALAGCVHAPYGTSLDRHNIGSTIQQPKTVSLIDATNGETVWSMDVPVGQTLVVDLRGRTWWTQSELTGAEPAERMHWGLFETGTWFGRLPERVDLAGNPVFLKMEIREPDEDEVREATITPAEPAEPPLPDVELEPAPEEENEELPEFELD